MFLGQEDSFIGSNGEPTKTPPETNIFTIQYITWLIMGALSELSNPNENLSAYKGILLDMPILKNLFTLTV